jgi:hypothetical protein
MSEYRPKIQDITHFRSLAIDEFKDLPVEVPGYKKFPTELRLPLAQLRSALKLLRKLGAIKPGWLEKQNMLVEKAEASPDVDERLRELLAPHIGENGDHEDIVQTLERILEERGNVLRNRNRR